MAFIAPTPVATRRSIAVPHSATHRRTSHSALAPRATATPPSRSPTPRPRAAAPVVDSRVSTRIEAHHWLVVRAGSERMFERAAVAQADVTRQLEARTNAGSLHRWVLREERSSSSYVARYVVTEAFAKSQEDTDGVFENLTRRWLSAVERVGPLVHAGESHTLHYGNVFTAKQHDVEFDPSVNRVVLESHAVRDEAVSTVHDALRAAAEASVASGRCLEFCVLQSTNDPSFFKTIQVYRDADALDEQLRRLDAGILHTVRSRSGHAQPTRSVFKPVMFA